MRQVNQQTEVVVSCSHICSKFCSIRSRSDESSFVHIKVKYLEFYVHALFSCVITYVTGSFQKLCICLIFGLLFPFTSKESNSFCSKILSLIYCLDQSSFCFLSALFVDIVRIQLRSEKSRLCAVADFQMRLLKNFLNFFSLSVICAFGNLDCVKIIINSNSLYLIYNTSVREGHPTDSTNLKILMNGFSHFSEPPVKK